MPRVVGELVPPITRSVFQRLGPKLWLRICFRLRPADGMAAHDSRNDVDWLFLLIRDDFEGVAADGQRSFGAMKQKTRCVRGGGGRGTFSYLGGHLEFWIVQDRVLEVGRLSISFE